MILTDILNDMRNISAWLRGRAYCRFRGVEFREGLRVYGFPIILKDAAARISLGHDVVLHSDPRVNCAGIFGRVTLAAPFPDSRITIGNDSGLSGAAIFASRSVIIGNYVNIGANTIIYDTDFHPIDWFSRRMSKPHPRLHTAHPMGAIASDPVVIEDDVWVGANSIILKGVRIGQRAVLGAGSVVTHDVPPGTLWAGNPARFIRKIAD